jgi:hypothetical protein
MTTALDQFRIKMDGQEHLLNNVEYDKETGNIYLDLDDTISIQVEDVQNLFEKEIEILQVGCDDGYTRARIDSFYNDGETTNNLILGLSLN